MNGVAKNLRVSFGDVRYEVFCGLAEPLIASRVYYRVKDDTSIGLHGHHAELTE
jgi:hypothetical protein